MVSPECDDLIELKNDHDSRVDKLGERDWSSATSQEKFYSKGPDERD